MQYLTLLSILFPCIMGAALFVWKPTDRIIRNRYSITVVLITSALVLATAFCTWTYGGDAVAVTIARMSKHLVFEFRPDNVATIFGCIIGVLWPVTTIYAFNYMEHEGPEQGSEIEPETVRLQAVGAERRQRAFCIMSLRVASIRTFDCFVS